MKPMKRSQSAGARSIAYEDKLRELGRDRDADRFHEAEVETYVKPLRRVRGPILGYSGNTE